MGAPSNVITLTIKCDLDLDEIFGRVHVYTTQDKTMDWVLDEFCREKNVKRVSTFALRSATGQDYDLTKTISECNLGEGDLIYCYNKNPPKAKPPPKMRQKGSGGRIFLIAAILCLLVALAGIITVIVIYEIRNVNKRQYAVVVDAGSTSSKVYLYSWPTSLIYKTGKVKEESYDKIASLTSFMEHPSQASGPIVSSINSTILQKGLLKGSSPSVTRLYLGATAGMRMQYDRDKGAVDAMFKALRRDLPKQLELNVSNPEKQIRILTGTEEGIDAWITVNYLEGTLGTFVDDVFKKSNRPTIGSLDLGGASTQIAFAPNPADINPNSTGISSHYLYGKSYEVYSHSFLCYGKEQATFRSLALLVKEKNFSSTAPISNPCYPMGYEKELKAEDFLMVPCTKGKHGEEAYGFQIVVPDFVKPNTTYKFIGIGDYSSCKDNVGNFFRNGPCPASTCSFNSVYQPPITGNYKAFAGFYYVADFFNATEAKRKPKATYYDFEDSVRRYCAMDWKDISKKYGNNAYTANYCFDGIYVQRLLTGYGFVNGTWNRLNFVKEVKDSKVGWSLGFTILVSGRITLMASFATIALPLFIGLLILFCLLLCVAIVLAVLAYRNRRSRGGRFQTGASEGYGSI